MRRPSSTDAASGASSTTKVGNLNGKNLTQADDGKRIVFTVRGNFSNGKIAATLKVVPLSKITVTRCQLSDASGESQKIFGENFDALMPDGEEGKLIYMRKVGETEWQYAPAYDYGDDWASILNAMTLQVEDEVEIKVKADPSRTDVQQGDKVYTLTVEGYEP